MKISTKGRYAVVMMIDLARVYNEDKYLSLNDIALRNDISLKYLEKIMNSLRKKDFFITSRGIDGGYKLSKNPKEFKIGDIIKAAEEQIDIAPCINTTCNKKNKCYSFPLWIELNDVINDFLNSKTLDDYI